MKSAMSGVIGVIVACSVSVAAQWPKYPASDDPRDAEGKVRMDAPPPRTPDGHPDLSGVWMRANSGPARGGRGGGGRGATGAEAAPGAEGGRGGRGAEGGRGGAAAGRGGIPLEPVTAPFPFDPGAPPVATFFEAGGNITG